MWRHRVVVEARPPRQQLLDPNLIADTTKRYFMIKLKLVDMFMYMKPYPDWVGIMVPLTI